MFISGMTNYGEIIYSLFDVNACVCLDYMLW